MTYLSRVLQFGHDAFVLLVCDIEHSDPQHLLPLFHLYGVAIHSQLRTRRPFVLQRGDAFNECFNKNAIRHRELRRQQEVDGGYKQDNK